MVTDERRLKILELLKKETYMSVSDLSQNIFVSESTIRRYLTELEHEGFIKRVRGGASYIDPALAKWPFVFRNKTNIPEKLHIARLAASFVNEGDTLFLDASSTCLFLAKELSKNISLDILTYGIPAAQVLAENRKAFVELPCGQYNPDRSSIYGKDACDFFSSRYANTCFISAQGLDARQGLTEFSREEVFLKKTLHEHAKQTIVLLDHTKINKIHYIQALTLQDIDVLITDQPLPEELDQEFYKYDIPVIYE